MVISSSFYSHTLYAPKNRLVILNKSHVFVVADNKWNQNKKYTYASICQLYDLHN
jgi:hypothetical protein